MCDCSLRRAWYTARSCLSPARDNATARAWPRLAPPRLAAHSPQLRTRHNRVQHKGVSNSAPPARSHSTHAHASAHARTPERMLDVSPSSGRVVNFGWAGRLNFLPTAMIIPASSPRRQSTTAELEWPTSCDGKTRERPKQRRATRHSWPTNHSSRPTRNAITPESPHGQRPP